MQRIAHLAIPLPEAKKLSPPSPVPAHALASAPRPRVSPISRCRRTHSKPGISLKYTSWGSDSTNTQVRLYILPSLQFAFGRRPPLSHSSGVTAAMGDTYIPGRIARSTLIIIILLRLPCIEFPFIMLRAEPSSPYLLCRGPTSPLILKLFASRERRPRNVNRVLDVPSSHRIALDSPSAIIGSTATSTAFSFVARASTA